MRQQQQRRRGGAEELRQIWTHTELHARRRGRDGSKQARHTTTILRLSPSTRVLPSSYRAVCVCVCRSVVPWSGAGGRCRRCESAGGGETVIARQPARRGNGDEPTRVATRPPTRPDRRDSDDDREGRRSEMR